MNVTLNGEAQSLAELTTVGDLVASQPKQSMAVAVNGAVIPRSAHATTRLQDGDVVELVTAVAGG